MFLLIPTEQENIQWYGNICEPIGEKAVFIIMQSWMLQTMHFAPFIIIIIIMKDGCIFSAYAQ